MKDNRDILLDFAEKNTSNQIKIGEGLLKGYPVQFAADEFVVNVFGEEEDTNSDEEKPEGKRALLKESLLG